MNKQRLTYLFNSYIDKTATEVEKQEFFEYLSDPAYDPYLKELNEQYPFLQLPLQHLKDDVGAEILRAIFNGGTNSQLPEYPQPARTAHRVHFLKTAWFRYAAAIILIFTAIAIYYNYSRTTSATVTASSGEALAKVDVQPGYSRAVLTLSNGYKVELDSAASKTINDGTLAIENRSGQLIYENQPTASSSDLLRQKESGDRAGTGITYNTMTTPKGGQYQLTLPDGTKIWLNAASSITYPTTFTGKTREVTITGEAYFEVAKNSAAPFKVTINNEVEVEVLGTHFNINAYSDEAAIHTTLLEGKVRVINLKAPASSTHSKAVLEPGKQALVWRNTAKSNRMEVVAANTGNVMAWRNGKFNFEGKELKDAMKELVRWYDIEVVYEKDLPQIIFEGKIDRHLKLSQILNGLKDMGAQFNLTGDRRLIIGPPK